MLKRSRACFLVATLVTGALAASGHGFGPLAVSPGAVDRFTGVEASCPTFSWQTFPGATGYQVLVYELPPEIDPAVWRSEDAIEVLFVELPAGVNAWTPALENGLNRDARHVWFVRAVLEDPESESPEATEWSEARYFRVAGPAPVADDVTRYLGAHDSLAPGTETADGSEHPAGSESEREADPTLTSVSRTAARDIGTAEAAIRAEMPDVAGEIYGVVGTSNSPDGAGLGAVNTAGGPDLVLDGEQDGQADLDVYEWGVDRPSSDPQAFSLRNSAGGGISLWIDGEEAVTTATDQDTLGGLSCASYEIAKWTRSGWTCAQDQDSLSQLPCAPGEVAKWGGSDWICAPDIDTDTTYAAGSGLELVGNEFRTLGTGYANVIVVAQSGGDFTSIQSAVDSVTDATASNPYLVWVAPGVYTEAVTLKPHVHLQGAGQGATVITSNVSTSNTPPDVGTVILASDSSVRDVTAENHGSGSRNVAVLASAGVARTVLSRSTARASGGGSMYIAVVIAGAGTSANLYDVTALAEDGFSNYAAWNYTGASTIMVGGSYTARNGLAACGLFSQGVDTNLEARDTRFVGQDATNETYGINSGSGAQIVMRGGRVIASGGDEATGVITGGPPSVFDAVGATILAEGGVTETVGLRFGGAGNVRVVGGSVIGRGGASAWGVRGDPSGMVVEMADVTVLGEDATGPNYGLSFDGVESVILNGLTIEAYSGTSAIGISNVDAPMVAYNVTALARSGSDSNYGLFVGAGAEATVVGGSYRGRGPGTECAGVYASEAGTVLEARGVGGYADSGFTNNSGLLCDTGASASWSGGVLDGWGGTDASGIKVADAATEVNAMGAHIKAEGVFNSYTINMDGGTVRVAFSKMSGGVNGAATGSLTCAYAIDETLGTYNCVPVNR